MDELRDQQEIGHQDKDSDPSRLNGAHRDAHGNESFDPTATAEFSKVTDEEFTADYESEWTQMLQEVLQREGYQVHIFDASQQIVLSREAGALVNDRQVPTLQLDTPALQSTDRVVFTPHVKDEDITWAVRYQSQGKHVSNTLMYFDPYSSIEPINLVDIVKDLPIGDQTQLNSSKNILQIKVRMTNNHILIGIKQKEVNDTDAFHQEKIDKTAQRMDQELADAIISDAPTNEVHKVK